MIVFHVLHPDEMEFPFDGMVKFDGMEERCEAVDAAAPDPPGVSAGRETYLEELQAGCERNRCDYVLMNTGKPLAETLTAYLATAAEDAVEVDCCN